MNAPIAHRFLIDSSFSFADQHWLILQIRRQIAVGYLIFFNYSSTLLFCIDFVLCRSEDTALLILSFKDVNAFKKQLFNKYNSDYADRIVLWAKIKWLEYKKDWPAYCKNVMLAILMGHFKVGIVCPIWTRTIEWQDYYCLENWVTIAVAWSAIFEKK